MCRAMQGYVGIMWDYFGSCRAALILCREYVCKSGLIGITFRVMWAYMQELLGIYKICIVKGSAGLLPVVVGGRGGAGSGTQRSSGVPVLRLRVKG